MSAGRTAATSMLRRALSRWLFMLSGGIVQVASLAYSARDRGGVVAFMLLSWACYMVGAILAEA